MDRETVNQKLKEYYPFDDSDLWENNNGRLTQKQVVRIKSHSQLIRIAGYAGGIFCLSIALCLGTVIPLVLLSAVLGGGEINTIVALIVIGLGFLVFLVVGIWMLLATKSLDKTSSVFKHVCGPVVIRAHDRVVHGKNTHESHYTVYKMSIHDSREFLLDNELLDIVKEGDEYAINYVDFRNPLGALLLSVEKL